MSMAVQLDLFDLIAEARRNAPALCLFDSTARGLAARAAELELWRAEYDSFGCVPRSHAWHHATTHPRTPTAECRPSCLDADLRCTAMRHSWDQGCRIQCLCVGALIYRGACTGCDWEGEPRVGENEAAEDAHDHAWPGWRDLPVIKSAKPTAPRQAARWTAEAIAVYPPGWIESGGPVRTLRGPIGNRHVPSRTPFGGYDMAAGETP